MNGRRRHAITTERAYNLGIKPGKVGEHAVKIVAVRDLDQSFKYWARAERVKMFSRPPEPEIAGAVVSEPDPKPMTRENRAIGRDEVRRHAAVSARRQRFPSQRLNGLAR